MMTQTTSKYKISIPMNPDGFFTLAIAEGEGIGTAYEYYAKFHLMKKVIESNKNGKTLIFGLPEKYGYSLDFVLYSNYINSSLIIVDDRVDRLAEHKKICKSLFGEEIVNQIEYVHINNWDEPYPISSDVGLALSSEVFQRLTPKQRKVYSKNLLSIPKVAVFAPNAKNSSHATTSGLKTCSVDELGVSFQNFNNRHMGYVDFFLSPPGLHLKKKNKTMLKKKSGVVSFGLQSWYALAEKAFKFMPTESLHHIVYLIAT